MNSAAVVVALMLVLLPATGCAPRNPTLITYYHFDTRFEERDFAAPLEQPRLELLPTRLPEHLSSRALVQRVDSQRLAAANWHQWASPPSKMLDRAALDTLENALPGWFVVGGDQRLPSAGPPGSVPRYRLQFELVRFNGGLNGDAELAGSWLLYDDTDRLLYRKHFSRTIALGRDGYAGLAEALQEGWLAVCRHAAAKIIRTRFDAG